MEKIYMEENQKRRQNANPSVMMSFVLAFVAIVSIVAYGFGRVSFAIPEASEEKFPETITTGSESEDEYVVLGPIATKQIRLHRASVSEGNEQYVYCIESEKDINSNTVYNKDSAEISDKGLLFLLNYLTSGKYNIVDGNGNAIDAKAAGWIKQTAIWTYLHQIGAPNNGDSYFDDEAIRNVYVEKQLYLASDRGTYILNLSAPIYETCYLSGSDLVGEDAIIKNIVDRAKKIHSGAINYSIFDLKVTSKSDEVSLTSDEKYYQSDMITVSGSVGLEGFTVDLSGIEGMYAVDEDGKKLESTDNLPAGSKFFIRVPVDKITDDNKNVTFEIVGAFKGDIAYRYTSEGSQSIAYSAEVTKRISKGLTVPYDYSPRVEDTFLTTAQSIYFIGLVILLAGVGIIYANIKPTKVNE